MAEIDGEEHTARDHVARIRADLHEADRGAGIGLVGKADAIDLLHHPRGANQRVAAARHRRRAGMRLLSHHSYLVPALALRAGDNADRFLLRLQDRPLLDMRLEIGFHGLAHRRRALIADAAQLVAQLQPVNILLGLDFIQREHPGEHAGAHHRRGEARAFLIGPHHHLNRRLGLDTGIVQRAHHFQPRQHAIDAVESAAGRLGVKMAAGHHRRQVVILAGAAGEDIADGIHRDGAAGFLAPAHEQVAAFLIQIAGRQAAIAALLGRADLRHLHQAVPQPVAPDLDILHRTASLFVLRHMPAYPVLCHVASVLLVTDTHNIHSSQA